MVTTNDSWRRYLEAGAAVGQVTVARAEEIAKGLVASGQEEREAAWREFEQLTRIGRRIGGQLVATARSEVSKQLEVLGAGSFERLLERFSELLSPSVAGPDSPDRPDGEPGSPHRVTPLETSVVPTAKSEKSPPHRDPKKAKAKEKAKKPKKGKVKAERAAKPERLADPGRGKVNKAKENGPVSPPRSSGPGRVLTMAQPPDSPGSL